MQNNNQSVINLLKLLFYNGTVFISYEKQTTGDYFCLTKNSHHENY